MQSLISITENNNITQYKKENEEYKTLVISKDNEISKLNDIITSKENEINRLKKETEKLKKSSSVDEMEKKFNEEKEILNNKINDLELKIYNINDEKAKLQKKINSDKNNNSNGGNNEDGKDYILLKEQNEELRKNYEELIISKNELEEENKNLKKKTKKKKKKNKDKDNLNSENEENNEDKEKEEKNENDDINYEKELSNLRKLLYEYETGKIISDNTKKTIDLLKNDSISQIEQLKVKMDELNTINNTKIKEYENNIFNANNEIKQKTKSISEFEKIAIKQEDKIEELNKQISILNKQIFNKELSMKKNENYSLQLMTIINEQKIKIKDMKNKNIELNNDEIIVLKKQIEKLKNEIEIKENIIQTMKKGHKILQDKYLNVCYNVRKKEQEDLLRQAKILQKQKMEREYISFRLRSQPMSKSGSLSSFPVKKNNKKNNIKNIKDNNNKNLNKNSLPNINNHNLKNGEGSKINNEGEISKGDNLEKINDMMKQIIEEN